MKPRRIRHIKCCNVMSDRKWLFKIATVQGSLVYGRVIRNFVGPMWKTEIIMVRMGLLTPYFECRNQMKPIICCGFISELLLARARDKSCLPLSYSIQFVWFISNTLHEVIPSKTAQSLDHHGSVFCEDKNIKREFSGKKREQVSIVYVTFCLICKF